MHRRVVLLGMQLDYLYLECYGVLLAPSEHLQIFVYNIYIINKYKYLLHMTFYLFIYFRFVPLPWFQK